MNIRKVLSIMGLATWLMASSVFAQSGVQVISAAPNFFDISATGDPISLGDDALSGAVPIGFDFPFSGADQTEVFIDSNGYLEFNGTSGGDFSNDCPVAPGTSPDDAIYVYWDDLDPGDDGALIFTESFVGDCPVSTTLATDTCLIVQYEEFDFFPGDGTPGGTAGTFQTVLFSNGTILNQYAAGFLGDGGGATIGLNTNEGPLLFECDTPGSITADSALAFVDVPPPVVPTLNNIGLIAMMLVLMFAGVVTVRRTRG